MPTPEAREKAVIDEVIKITTWKNIRRYIILGGIGFVILDLIITLTVVVLLAIDTRNSDKQRAIDACQGRATLAQIERTTVKQQQKQTANLEKQGFTFGLPKAQFDKLVQRSNARTHRYLTALSDLGDAACSDLKA